MAGAGSDKIYTVLKTLIPYDLPAMKGHRIAAGSPFVLKIILERRQDETPPTFIQD